MEVLEARLDGALGNLVCWEVSQRTAGGWNWVIFEVSSNFDYSVISHSAEASANRGASVHQPAAPAC